MEKKEREKKKKKFRVFLFFFPEVFLKRSFLLSFFLSNFLFCKKKALFFSLLQSLLKRLQRRVPGLQLRPQERPQRREVVRGQTGNDVAAGVLDDDAVREGTRQLPRQRRDVVSFSNYMDRGGPDAASSRRRRRPVLICSVLAVPVAAPALSTGPASPFASALLLSFSFFLSLQRRADGRLGPDPADEHGEARAGGGSQVGEARREHERGSGRGRRRRRGRSV